MTGISLQNLFWSVIKPIIKFPYRHGLVLRAILKASSKCECGNGEIPRGKVQSMKIPAFLLAQTRPASRTASGQASHTGPAKHQRLALLLPSPNLQISNRWSPQGSNRLSGHTQYFAWKNSLMYLITDQIQVLHIYSLKAWNGLIYHSPASWHWCMCLYRVAMSLVLFDLSAGSFYFWISTYSWQYIKQSVLISLGLSALT